ncbi:mobile mystery protein A [Vibrio europaeus]|uniref:mobile mystery protein A n=1 Tax=Vibrio europaeus TaxID=300876 RepID=UPI00233EF5AF|nr:mobile mystery protein A [Vibrio europaeus]MDC5820392.1 mobile mystery protein A [Vibrio europaeus]
MKKSGVYAVALKQVKAKISALLDLSVPKPPKNGWVRSIREALGMSGAQLGERLNLSRNQVSILERKEADETITLRQLKQLASGLDAELVYAIVPRQSIDDMIEARAMELAKQRLAMSHQSMFLEAQQLTSEQQQQALVQLANEIKTGSTRDLWKVSLQEKYQ